VANDPANTLFTQTVAAGLAAPTPGHWIDMAIVVSLSGGTAGDIRVDFTDLVIGWR
jgi:hypothetical protein